MKRLVSLLFALTVLAIGSVAFAGSFGYGYPDYLNGDTNYIRATGRMGYAKYIDRSALNVEEYDPPNYIISVRVVEAVGVNGHNDKEFYKRDGAGKITGSRNYRFYYNWDERRMYVERKDDWYYLKSDSSITTAEGSEERAVGELAFYLAYGMKFYDCYQDAFFFHAD